MAVESHELGARSIVNATLRRWIRGEHVVEHKLGGEWEPDQDVAFACALVAAPRYCGALYRGTSLSEESLRMLAIGSPLSQSGSRSWTSSFDFAVDWAERHAVAGRRAVVLSLAKSSTARDLRGLNPVQSEVVLPAGARFQVLDVRDGACVEVVLRQSRGQRGR